MKKTVVSFALLCVLCFTLFIPVYANSPQEETPNITVTTVDKSSGEIVQNNLQLPTVPTIDTGLSQEDLLNLTAEEQNEISLNYLNSLPQTRSHTHKWVWKGSQPQLVEVIQNGSSTFVWGWLILHECSTCGAAQYTIQI